MVVRQRTSSVRRAFTRSEYERMGALGIIGPDERVELVEGEILTRSPQGARHSMVVLLIADALREAFGKRRTVRTQMPVAVDGMSEPEPDVAVVEGSPLDYKDAHPTTALLVVEVSDTTLARDRRKARVYAKAKVPEYWIANLVEGVLEVHREPHEVRGTWAYADVQRLEPALAVHPLGAPKAKLKVSDLLGQ